MEAIRRDGIHVVHVSDDATAESLISGLEAQSDGIAAVADVEPDSLRSRLESGFQPADCILYHCPDADSLAFVDDLTDAVQHVPVVVYDRDRPRVAADAVTTGATDFAVTHPERDPAVELATRVVQAVERAELRRRSRQYDHINSVIRAIVRRVVSVETVSELERGVCEQFADAEPYCFAWIGEPDPASDEVLARATGGDATTYLNDVTVKYDAVSPEGRGPGGRAVRAGETQVVQNMPTDLSFTPWQEQADRYGFQSLIVLPLDLDGPFHGILAIYSDRPAAFDETERAVLEELADIIEGAIAAIRTRDALEEHERELQRRNDRLDEFASILAHDLRNPLQVAQARLGMIDTDDEDQVAVIRDAHDRMEALIENLLVLAREGESSTETELLALPDLVRDGWRNVDTADATRINEATGVIEADETQVKRAVENLVRNAVEHAGPEVTVRVGDLDDGFYVEDDGPGIPSDQRDRVFRAHHSSAGDGTGLGLAIVEQVAENHGWDVSIVTGESGGARFEFTGISRR